jgi:hypothetical protein
VNLSAQWKSARPSPGNIKPCVSNELSKEVPTSIDLRRRRKRELAVSVSKMNVCPIPIFRLFDLADIHPVVDAHIQKSQSSAVWLHAKVVWPFVATKGVQVSVFYAADGDSSYLISANRTARSERPTPPQPYAQDGPLIAPIAVNVKAPVLAAYDVFIHVIVPSFWFNNTTSHLPSPSISARRMPLRS